MNQIDVMYLFPNTPEPRNENIINLIKNQYNVGVMYWKKTPDSKEYGLDNCRVFEKKISADDSNPMRRILPMFKYFRAALRTLKEEKPRCLHVSKVDSMMMAAFYKRHSKIKPKIVYDISDLHTLAYNDKKDLKSLFIKKILWEIEKYICSQVDYILVTSPKFYDEYYKSFYKREQVIFVPNAPDVTCFDGFKKKQSGEFTLGFIGSVRYYNQMTKLIDVSTEMGVNVLIAGSGESEQALREYSKDMANVIIFGKYDYKTEIKELYEKIDCVYALYDTSIKNVRVALPNKLYEGAFCGLPFIASKGVYVAELIEDYGFGVAAEDGNAKDLKFAIESVKKLSPEAIKEGCLKFSSENSFIECSKNLLVAYRTLLGRE